MKKIIVVGATGRLGKELLRAWKKIMRASVPDVQALISS